jgi:hypothetical protein
MKRILLTLLLAWVAIAPAFANACAADCESRNMAASLDQPPEADHSDAASLDVPDCHGTPIDDGEPADPHGPGNASMVASCYFAAAASMSGPASLCLIVDVVVQRSTSVLLSPTPIIPAPPEKPPQA